MNTRRKWFNIVIIVSLVLGVIPSLFLLPQGAQAQSTTYSVWPDPVTPGFAYDNPNPIEMGLKFRSDVAGYVTGVRFFKAVGTTGTHIGRLYTTGGAKLAEVTFINETASGWQSALFPTAVAIQPDTTYIIAYYVGDGNRRFSDTFDFFASSGVDNPPLHALAAEVDGPNGVFSDTGGFFNQTYRSSNYWVDLIFDATPDTTPPTVSTVSPVGGAIGVSVSANVTVGFSEALEASTIDASTFELRDPSNNLISASITYNSTSHSATLDPNTNLSFATTYHALVRGGSSGVKDAAGNPLAADYTWSFTTETSDTTPPTVNTVAPVNHATEVLIAANVSAVFSEAMDPATISGATFELRDPYNVAVLASVTYDAGSNSALLDPAADLNFGATYTARIRGGDTGVQDAAGNALEADYVWTFTTTTPPTVSSVSPTNGAIDVLISSDISAVFSKAMDASTINAANFELRDSANNLVNAAVIYDSESHSATLNPASNLSYSTVYTARVRGGSSGVKDLAGNPLASDYTWSFTTESMLTTPPTVTSVKPINGVTGLRLATNATAYFSRAMDPDTLNADTFELRDAGNNLIAATITYDSGNNSATLNPDSDLDYFATYTARIKSGPTGVKDTNGIALAADYTWSFGTVAQRPPVDHAPGGPILVIVSPANLFTRYYAEILRTEGLNEFAISDLAQVTAQTLAAYDVVILGEIPLTADQVLMFTTWVTNGGHLIAMRPDKQLVNLLGLTDAVATLSNGYLQIDTADGPGVGIVGQTLQFHGTADAYTLNGATSLANLYSDRTTATTYPAVTLRSIGPHGGAAAAFAFDLARSIVYTHQGNPAWQIGHVNPLQSYGTALDLFYDATTPWVDFNRIGIPQADEQQRFLANLILSMNADQTPLPRFWYFPGGKKAAIILTGDDHWGRSTPSGSSQAFFDRHISQSPANCSVADWECVRSSSYGYEGALLTDSQAAAYIAQGFDFGVHADAGLASGGGWCGTWPSDMPAQYASQFEGVMTKYASIPVQGSERSHCYSWFGYTGDANWHGYAGQPEIEANLGIRLDTNISYNPSSWASVNPGYQMGSGMLMRFVQVAPDGTATALLDIHNGGTQMTDDNGQGAAAMRMIVDSYLDAAIGAQGYYGAFVVNMHSDNWYGWSYQGSDQIVASAQAHNIPVVSGSQMVDWLAGRNSSAFNSITWDGTTLRFNITVGDGARNLQAMVPAAMGIVPVNTITRNGQPIAHTTQTIKGVNYAFFNATAGAYEVTYTPDTTPPTISAMAANPTTGENATITWNTDEPSTSRIDYGTQPNALTLNVVNSALVNQHTVTLMGLLPNTQYYYRVTSSDASGNAATSPETGNAPATFTTPSASFIDTTVADFSAGTPDANITISQMSDGEVILKPVVSTEFSGASLPAGWSIQGGGGGTATVNNGQLIVDGTNVGTTATYGPGRSLEAVATFGGAPFQHVGFGINLSGSSGDAWAIISTGSSGSGLFARTWNGSGAWSSETSTAIPGSYFGAPHRYRIDWDTNAIDYNVDGVKVATHNLTLAIPMRPMVSDSSIGGPTVTADWLRVTSYADSGTYTSQVFDALGAVQSGTIAWSADTPTGTTLVLNLRTGNTPWLDASWTSFSPIGNGDAIGSGFRYLQYRADLSTTDLNQTPALRSVNIPYNTTPDTTPPSIMTRTPAVNATNVTLDMHVVIDFDELMNAATINASTIRLRAAGDSNDVAATVTASGSTVTLQPIGQLAPNVIYQVTVSGSVADRAGNTLGSDSVWTFTTTPYGDFVDTTVADFSAGQLDANTYPAQMNNGEVLLAPIVGSEFSGSALPSGWSSASFGGGGSTTVSNGTLTLDGTRAGPDAVYSPGHTLEGWGTFSAAPFQHFGFGATYAVDGNPWILISTGENGDGLYARTYTGVGDWHLEQRTAIPGSFFGTPHLYRIDWLADRIDYYVDGVLVATHNVVIPNQLRPLPADSQAGGPMLVVDWLRMSPYAVSGTFVSRVFDANTSVYWLTANPTSRMPASTGIAVETRTSVDNVSWSNWQATASGNITCPPGRYFQYRAMLSTSDSRLTPVLEEVALTYRSATYPPPPLPSRFYGEIHISDPALNSGDLVQVHIGGVSRVITTAITSLVVDSLTYQIDVPGDISGTPEKEGGAEGDVITFTISSRVVATGIWHSGTNPQLDFHSTSISLQPGWNLVSFNLRPASTAIADVLSGLAGHYDLVYAWDAATQQWRKYDDVDMSQDTLLSLDERSGFWIHLTTTAQSLTVYGQRPATTDISLASGWNLVGYPSSTARALPGALSDHGVGDNFTLVYAYHANDADPWKLFDRNGPPFVNDLSELAPGWGYWIQVTSPVTWHVAYVAP